MHGGGGCSHFTDLQVKKKKTTQTGLYLHGLQMDIQTWRLKWNEVLEDRKRHLQWLEPFQCWFLIDVL